MKLFISRDASPSDVYFVINDENGREKYTAVARHYKRGVRGISKSIVRLNILDENKNLAARLNKVPLAAVNSFSLKTPGASLTLVIILTDNMVQCKLYGCNWRISGNIASKNFSIIDVDNTPVCNHTKHSGYCELEIADPKNELPCLLAALCVNMINTVDKLAVGVV